MPLHFIAYSTFSPTDMCGNRASDWNTMQVGRWLAGTSLMRRPRSRMSPLVGVSMPTSIRTSVVLPEPDGPTIVKNSPSTMSSDTRSTAAKGPKNLSMSRSCRIGTAIVRASGR